MTLSSDEQQKVTDATARRAHQVLPSWGRAPTFRGEQICGWTATSSEFKRSAHASRRGKRLTCLGRYPLLVVDAGG